MKSANLRLTTRKWKVLSGLLVIASSFAASAIVKKSWALVGDKKPPQHPRLPTADLKTAVVVAGISGIASAFLKFAVIRFAGGHWQRYGGELPDQEGWAVKQ